MDTHMSPRASNVAADVMIFFPRPGRSFIALLLDVAPFVSYRDAGRHYSALRQNQSRLCSTWCRPACRFEQKGNVDNCMRDIVTWDDHKHVVLHRFESSCVHRSLVSEHIEFIRDNESRWQTGEIGLHQRSKVGCLCAVVSKCVGEQRVVHVLKKGRLVGKLERRIEQHLNDIE
ncbi:hypothetical protein PRIPAC_78484 [Pristionchus pacificus]|uniref:Uncharacterized protein n=1 Tax=Pristionchus pacificus TaxID=54126 RepID=A0A2A6C3G4_PRIPA|nr:hypothetical protein PRIPAC_78484 [Pristionchus pacificus]|eukprot:PDM72715.1 hypothetical protein PRIPAC_39149 [Pristionchus pacificus]